MRKHAAAGLDRSVVANSGGTLSSRVRLLASKLHVPSTASNVSHAVKSMAAKHGHHALLAANSARRRRLLSSRGAKRGRLWHRKPARLSPAPSSLKRGSSSVRSVGASVSQR